MENTITGRAIDLNISADFLQNVGMWDYNSQTPSGKMYQEVTVTIEDDGRVTAFGQEVNVAAELRVKELLSA